MNLVISQGSIQSYCETEMSLWSTANVPVILALIRNEGILRITFSTWKKKKKPQLKYDGNVWMIYREIFP